MVGLSVVLEGYKDISKSNVSQIVNKSRTIKITSPTTPTPSSPNPFSRRSFLEHCFLCTRNLLAGQDIYMYKGDRAFCSEECRCRQIFMDEEETTIIVNPKIDHCSSSRTSSKSSGSRKGSNKRAIF